MNSEWKVTAIILLPPLFYITLLSTSSQQELRKLKPFHRYQHTQAHTMNFQKKNPKQNILPKYSKA